MYVKTVVVSLGAVQAVDPDLNDILKYSLVGSDRPSGVSIDSQTGQVSFRSDWLDYELQTSYRFTVQVTDSGGLTDACEMTLTVVDGNDPPAFAIGALTIDENPSPGAHIGGLRYEMIEPNEHYAVSIVDSSCPFEIEPVSNFLLVRDPTKFDFESAPTVNCTLLLIDDAVSRRSTFQTISITLGDLNEAPTIPPQQRGSALESATRGQLIMTVAASDQDTRAVWSSLRFRLVDNSVFAIDSSSGIVTVRSPSALDFETKQEYSLAVEVIDGGLLASEEVVYISILNSEERPVILPPHHVDVPEMGVVPRTIFIVNASDPDSVSNEDLRFQILGSSPFITIDSHTGVLTLVQSLDYEMATSVSVLVDVFKPAAPGLNQTTEFVINVTNVNEPPQVFSSMIRLQVKENLPAETPLGVPMSSNTWDPENNTLVFQLDASEFSPFFSVDACSGQLRMKQPLDYEAMPRELPLSILVHDNVDTSTNVAISVLIAVEDVNETPAFLRDEYAFSIPEDAAAGDSIGILSAVDPDAGAVFGFALASGDYSSLFKVDSATGKVSLLATGILDFETKFSYTLLASVSDSALSSAAKIVIQVVDVNEPPRCSPETRFISENVAIGTVISPKISTSDVDTGDVGFKPTLELIESTEASGLFTFSQNSLVVLTTALDFETTSQYELIFSTCDQLGACSKCTLEIQILDKNEAPEIPDAHFQIAENSVGWVYTVAASDQDTNQTAALLYEIVDQSIVNLFSIEPTGGQLKVLNSSLLNYEKIDNHEAWLKVSVTDTGSPRLSSTGKITALVQDVNEAPTCEPLINVTFPENMPLGSVVFKWNVDDEDLNQQLTYRISSGNEDRAFGFAGVTVSILTLLGSIDFEQISGYTLGLSACDPFMACASSLLHIVIQDTNDTPSFYVSGNRTLSFSVSNHAKKGTVVGALHAADQDVGDVLTFSVEPPTSTQLSDQVLDGRLAIGVNSTTGELTVVSNAALQALPEGSHFVLTAKVTDTSLSWDAVTVIVDVITKNSPPECAVDSVFLVDENADPGTKVGLALRNYTRDDDIGTVFSFTLDHSFLSVHSGTGQLFISKSPNFDFESPSLKELDVSVLVSDDGAYHDGIGRLSTTCSVHITSRDVNEPPTTAKLSLTISEGILNLVMLLLLCVGITNFLRACDIDISSGDNSLPTQTFEFPVLAAGDDYEILKAASGFTLQTSRTTLRMGYDAFLKADVGVVLTFSSISLLETMKLSQVRIRFNVSASHSLVLYLTSQLIGFCYVMMTMHRYHLLKSGLSPFRSAF